MSRAKVSDYGSYRRTQNYIILEDILKTNRKPTVLRFKISNGYNRSSWSLHLVDGEWPDMKDFADNHSGAVVYCGGHNFREDKDTYNRNHIGFDVMGCD